MGKIVRFFLLLNVGISVCFAIQNDIAWTPHARFKYNQINESSGLVRSRQFENVFWTHNDRGDNARIFAVTIDGDLIREVQVSGAQNVDWEDIAIDAAGHLYIGDFGNNRKNEPELAIYVVKEPDPHKSSPVSVLKRIPFDFPKRHSLREFDCEALFWAKEHLYILTKHKREKITRLYKFAPLVSDVSQTVTHIADFDVGGVVTAADASVDGNKLLLLCYEYIYLFEKPPDSDNYLAGKFKRILLAGRKSEAICFSGADVVFSNEEGEIYKLPQSIFDTHNAFIPELPLIDATKINRYQIDGLADEWATANELDLNISAAHAMKGSDCKEPSVRVGWTVDGLLLLVQDLRPPGTKKKKKKLLRLMLAPNNQRTVGLPSDAFIWELSSSKGSYKFKRKHPASQYRLAEPRLAHRGNKDRTTLEILIPMSVTNFFGKRTLDEMLFNLILNPKSVCEWYWAADASMNSSDNTYLWGKVQLQE